ncbi:MAG: branched-chain amino acid aminotransferase [Rikenellaceae bacterium]
MVAGIIIRKSNKDMKNIDWSNLGFGYIKCNTNVRVECKDGVWGEITTHTEDTIPLHISAAALHYGAEAFEGLKAFMGEDGKVRLFRPEDNARRLISSAHRLCMAEPPVELFMEMVKMVASQNIEFVPPYGTGASLYIRPVLLGSDATLGIKPGHEYTLVVFVSPVGAYFKGGMDMIDVIVNTDYDRAAPRGTGAVKAGGNYACSIYPGEEAHKKGYSNVLYLDAVERQYVEECGAANFFGIKDGRYVTPESPSILPSITNMSLRTLAAELGLKVEQRPIPFEEVSTFDECGACGTAAVISPIGTIFDPETEETLTFGTEVGAYCKAMYDKLQDIQYGRCDDPYGWTVIVE